MAFITPLRLCHCAIAAPRHLAPEYNAWGSWKWESRTWSPPSPSSQYTKNLATFFTSRGQQQPRPSTLRGCYPHHLPSVCSPPRDPLAFLRFLFPCTSCPGIVLFLAALAPSTRLLSPQPRSAWGQPSIHKRLGKSREAWSHFPGKFHSPALFVGGLS